MQKSWKSSGWSLAFVLTIAGQGCGGSDIPAVDGEDAALKGGIPASENGKGRRPDGVAGANGSGSVDDEDQSVDAGVNDACAPRAKGASSMRANDKAADKAKEKSGVTDTDAKGKSGECHGGKAGGTGADKGTPAERGKGGDKGSAAGSAEDDDADQAQDENSDD
jgi:hypothetical protein